MIHSGLTFGASRVLNVDPKNKQHCVFELSPNVKYIMHLFAKTTLKYHVILL